MKAPFCCVERGLQREGMAGSRRVVWFGGELDVHPSFSDAVIRAFACTARLLSPPQKRPLPCCTMLNIIGTRMNTR